MESSGATNSCHRSLQIENLPTLQIKRYKAPELNHCGSQELKPTGPALVWSKGDESVPETSLLRLGADRLLGTSYGSREESGLDNHGIMLTEGWLPVWTAGNRVFTWTAGSDANNRTLPAM